MKMNSFFENLSETLDYLDDDTAIDLDSEIGTDPVEEPALPDSEPVTEEPTPEVPEVTEPVENTDSIEESKEDCENCLQNDDLNEIMNLITSLGTKLSEKGLIKNFNISWEIGDNELADKPEEPAQEVLPPTDVVEETVFEGPVPTETPASEPIEEPPVVSDVWELKNASLDDVESIKIYCQIYNLPVPVISDNNDKTFSVTVPGLSPEEKSLLDSKLE